MFSKRGVCSPIQIAVNAPKRNFRGGGGSGLRLRGNSNTSRGVARRVRALAAVQNIWRGCPDPPGYAPEHKIFLLMDHLYKGCRSLSYLIIERLPK